MTDDIKRATRELVAAIEAARLRLPRRHTAGEQATYAAEAELMALCRIARDGISEQWKRIERRREQRSYRTWVRPADKEAEEMKRQVIDAGYRALAAKLHPDVGGSGADMIRLNRTRDRLRKV